MEGVMIKDDEWRDGLGVKLFNLQQSGQFCDVIIKTIEDARLLVHSCILAAASPLLKGVIESALSDSSLGTIMLSSDIDLATWNHMLEFMYMGSTSVEVNLLPSLSNGASILKIDTLVNKCSEVIVEKPAQIEQEPITEPPPETADTELYPVIAQIKEDSDHGMDTEDYAIDVQEAPVSLEYVPSAASCVSAMPMTSQDSVTKDIQDSGHLQLTDDTEVEDDTYSTPVLTIVTHDSKGVLKQELDSISGLEENTSNGLSIEETYNSSTCTLTIVRTEDDCNKPDGEDDFKTDHLEVPVLVTQNPELSEKSLENVSMVNLEHETADDNAGELVLTDVEFELVGLTPKGKRQYRCCLCNTLCIDPTVHKMVHTELKPFVCNAIGCGKSYKSKAALKHHFLSNHAISVPHKCVKCGKVFRTEYLLKKHMTVTCNDSKPYVCQTCGKPFKTLPKLKYHEGIHAEVKPYKCNTCGKGMASKAHLKVHMIVHEEGNYNCFCGKHFKSVKRYREHYKLIHDPNNPFKCDICGKNYKNEAILEHHKLSHNRPYACRFCKKGFVQLLSCKLHERNQHKHGEHEVYDLKGNICPVCSKQYKSNKAMTVHFTVHSLDDKFECPRCDKKFKLEKHLQSHLVVHAERSVPCPKCGKMFKHEKNLKIHMNSHEKPFECNECGARFAHERYLLHHLDKHKEGLTPKIYRCPHCTNSYPSLSNVKLHMDEEHPHVAKLPIAPETPLSMLRAPKTRCTWRKYDGKTSPIKKSLSSGHSKVKRGTYDCDLCLDVFLQENQLLSHELKKHASSKLRCQECDVKFTTRRTLTKHQYVAHDIGQIIICYQCEREFYSENDLERHALIVHSLQEQGADGSELDRLGVSVCVICTEHFQSHELLEKHEKCHKISEMVCKICGQGFHSVDILKVHVKSCSEKQCIYCLQMFDSLSDLEKHIRFHQLGKVILKCSLCSEDFVNIVDLCEHKKVHEKVHEKVDLTPEKSQTSGFKSLLSAFAK